MKLKYGLFAKNLIRDDITNTWSAIQIFDEVVVQDFQQPLPEFYALLNVEHTDGAEVKIILREKESSESLFKKTGKMWINGTAKATNISVNLAGIKIPNAGRYELLIKEKGSNTNIGVLDLLVKQA